MKLFVGFLSMSVSERELWNAFERFGLVESVTIMNDRDTGQRRGFAFVEMTNENAAEAAINGLNGKMLGDKALHVTKALPREDGGFRRKSPHA